MNRLMHLEESELWRIYVIDDDASVRKSISRFLEVVGYKVITFKNASDALNSPDIRRDALLIADIHVHEIVDGLEKLRSRGINLPVICLADYDDQVYRQIAQKMCAAGYLIKPVEGQILIDAIMSVSLAE